jgi:hypothetical protein
MKAGHLLAPGRFEIVDVPIPTPGAGEAAVDPRNAEALLPQFAAPVG